MPNTSLTDSPPSPASMVPQAATPLPRTPELRVPDLRVPELRVPELRVPVRWTADRAVAPGWPMPSLTTAVGRGLLCRCPSCGKTPLFAGYLRVVDVCAVCAAPLGQARADDAPPYFTIFVVGHVIVLGMLLVEQSYAPPLWVHAAIWLPLTLVLSLMLLRPIKGGTVGLMLKLGLMRTADE